MGRGLNALILSKITKNCLQTTPPPNIDIPLKIWIRAWVTFYTLSIATCRNYSIQWNSQKRIYYTIDIENPYNINRNYRIQLEVREYKWKILEYKINEIYKIQMKKI